MYVMIQGLNTCINQKSHRTLVVFFPNHINQLVGRVVLINHHSFRSFHSLHSWWLIRTTLPTRWLMWFRKNTTRVTVGFPIKLSFDVYCFNKLTLDPVTASHFPTDSSGWSFCHTVCRTSQLCWPRSECLWGRRTCPGMRRGSSQMDDAPSWMKRMSSEFLSVPR